MQGKAALEAMDPGGIEVLEADLEAFRAALLRENHTLKRALTDPRLFAGIGNAYSDEILHRARLSPIAMTKALSEARWRGFMPPRATVLGEWIERLRAQTGEGFPDKVTAFREEMAVHGRYGKPCPACGAPVQRIVYAENETNYCARCQTERPDPRRPRAFAAAEEELAALDRRARMRARFRFDPALIAFLDRKARRGNRSTYDCARAATLKNAIEALGVPHTEVGRAHGQWRARDAAADRPRRRPGRGGGIEIGL